MPTLYDFTSEPSERVHAKRRDVDDDTRVGRHGVRASQHLDAIAPAPSAAGSPLAQYSFATRHLLAFSSPRMDRSCSAAASGASVPLPSVSSALVSRSRLISDCDVRLSDSICSSESFALSLSSGRMVFSQQCVEQRQCHLTDAWRCRRSVRVTATVTVLSFA